MRYFEKFQSIAKLYITFNIKSLGFSLSFQNLMAFLSLFLTNYCFWYCFQFQIVLLKYVKYTQLVQFLFPVSVKVAVGVVYVVAAPSRDSTWQYALASYSRNRRHWYLVQSWA